MLKDKTVMDHPHADTFTTIASNHTEHYSRTPSFLQKEKKCPIFSQPEISLFLAVILLLGPNVLLSFVI